MSQSKPRSPSTPHRQSQGGKDFRKRVQRSKQSGDPAPKQTTQPRAGNPAAKPAIILKAEREKSLQRRHPWIFSGAVECIDGAPASGDTVAVRDAAGNFLAWAAYNADSQITARVWSWHEKEVVDTAFFRKRIADALAARKTLGLDRDSNGMRLIHGESDGLPGLIVDKYGDVLVMQLGSAGAEHWRDTIADILQELCAPVCIYERSDSDGRELEGLPKRNGIVRGKLPEKVEVIENGLRFAVDVAEGQKTGYYLDQRDNRALTGSLAAARDVLNCFCYTGGFSLYALRGGAKSVLSIDSSQEALQLAQANVQLNGLDASKSGMAMRRRVRRPAQTARSEPQVRPHRTRPAQVRPHRRLRRKGLARLQGHQPARFQTAAPGRPAVHLLLLRRHQRRPVPENHRGRGIGCGSGCADREEAACSGGSSGVAEFPGRGVFEGIGIEGGIVHL